MSKKVVTCTCYQEHGRRLITKPTWPSGSTETRKCPISVKKTFGGATISVDCFHLTSSCPLLPATRQILHLLWGGPECLRGISSSWDTIDEGSSNSNVIGWPPICPSLCGVNNLYKKWLIEKKELSNGSAMFDQLEKIVEDYNRKNANVGGKCFL